MNARLARAPASNCSSIRGPDSRVSRPVTITGIRPPVRSAKCLASDAPIAQTVFESKGNSPALARIPSVPKSFVFLAVNFWFLEFGEVSVSVSVATSHKEPKHQCDRQRQQLQTPVFDEDAPQPTSATRGKVCK